MLLTQRALRTHVRRLPEADGDSGVTAGEGPLLRLLVLGDSTAAGVGAAVQREALVGQLAVAVTALTGRPVSWRVAARAGATVRRIRTRMPNRITEPAERWQPDLVLIAGTNDALHGRRPRAFRRDMDRLIGDVRLRLGHDVPVVLAGLPETDRLDALPRRLRVPLAWYVGLLDRQLKVLARRLPAVFHIHSGGPPRSPGNWFATDRFHPSAQGYRAWARTLAAGVATLVDPVPRPDTEPARPTEDAGRLTGEPGRLARDPGSESELAELLRVALPVLGDLHMEVEKDRRTQ
ncbi:SGNH/GDSL hydrolase family protein [Streptomyces sp. NPDC015127]|uniref:SGNH/GDSL hydrolase family protein n=1 Tax=Streptomyces sp. NPDC015127 TaxID=3364939 RepID=UPI0037000600